MQDMIKRIVDADNEARALAEQNLKEAEKQKARIEEQVEQIYAKSRDEAEETIRRNDALEEAKTEKQWAEISSKQNSALIKLKSEYDNNKQRWIEAIVGRVTG